jgi:nucleoside phosphorylase
MSILGQLADDLLAVIDDPVEIAEELGVPYDNETLLRGKLIKRINSLGPDLPMWLVGWQGRSVRKILRILDLPIPIHQASPGTMVRQWLEHRGIEMPFPRIRPRQLYRDITELLIQFSDPSGAYALARLVLPGFECLVRLLVAYFIQCLNDQDRCGLVQLYVNGSNASRTDKLSPSSFLDLLGASKLHALTSILASLPQVLAPPYTSSNSKIIELILPVESDALKKIGELSCLFENNKADNIEAIELIHQLNSFFNCWSMRFNNISEVIPRGAVVYAATKGMYCWRLKCRDEFEQSVIVDGVKEELSVRSELLLDSANEDEHWGDRITILPDNPPWTTISLNPERYRLSVQPLIKEDLHCESFNGTSQNRYARRLNLNEEKCVIQERKGPKKVCDTNPCGLYSNNDSDIREVVQGKGKASNVDLTINHIDMAERTVEPVIYQGNKSEKFGINSLINVSDAIIGNQSLEDSIMDSKVELTACVDIVIITALSKEQDAILRHLGHTEKIVTRNRVYYKAEISHTRSSDVLSVVVFSLEGMGNVQAGIATTQAITVWNPSQVILAGITAGIKEKDIKWESRWLGDVIIADQILGYELGKISSGATKRRYQVLRPAFQLIEAARALPPEKWAHCAKIGRPDGSSSRVVPKVHYGVVASGEKIVADPSFSEELISHWSQLAGIEMESYGTALAAYQAETVPGMLMIKGICDWADSSKNDEWQEYAADISAAFLVALLRDAPLLIRERPQAARRHKLEYSGKIKLTMSRRIGDNWRDLADYFEIPLHQRSRFKLGREMQDIWEWLELRNKLDGLKDALSFIDRQDLVAELDSVS